MLEKLLFDIKHDTVGKRYDSKGIFAYYNSLFMASKTEKLTQNGIVTIKAPQRRLVQFTKDKVICSHQIMKYLTKAMP